MSGCILYLDVVGFPIWYGHFMLQSGSLAANNRPEMYGCSGPNGPLVMDLTVLLQKEEVFVTETVKDVYLVADIMSCF